MRQEDFRAKLSLFSLNSPGRPSPPHLLSPLHHPHSIAALLRKRSHHTTQLHNVQDRSQDQPARGRRRRRQQQNFCGTYSDTPTPRRRSSSSPVASHLAAGRLNACIHRCGSAQDAASMVGMALDSFAGREGNLTPSFELASGSSALTPASSYRRATPPPSSTLSLAAMPPTLRPLPPRSPPSSSSAFAVSRRSPVSPRPAVSSPSGME